MTEKMLITKLVRKDNTRADLYQPRHRYADLILFELAMLGTVGIDYQDLPIGVETPCLFYAHWQESENLNQHGNPYKDIVALEPFDSDDTATDTMLLLTSIHGKLEMLVQMLALILGNQGIAVPKEQPPEDPPPPTPSGPHYGDGTPLGSNDAEQSAFKLYTQTHGSYPDSLADLRRWFKTQSGGQS